VLDFDAQLWLTSNNEDAERLCRPGDSVTLVDPSHVIYTGADGSAIKVGSPTREHRLGCA
jgi:hypothetical protein